MSLQQIKAIIIKHQTGWKQGDQEIPQLFLHPYFNQKQGHRHYKSTGVRIGAGIDLGNRTSKQIQKMFSQICQQSELKILSSAAKLNGKEAQEWVQKQKDKIKLCPESFIKLFDRHFQTISKTVYKIFDSQNFIECFKISGSELLNNMKPQYKMVMFDLFYIGRNNTSIRKKLIPTLIKIHQKTASDSEIADLNSRILKIYNGLSARRQSINDIINHGIENKKQQNQNANRKMKEFVKNNSSQFISKILQGKESGQFEFMGNSQNISSIRIDGFSLGSKFINIHIQQKEDNPFLKDLIVPLKIFYDNNIQFKNVSISIDPQDPYNPDGPLYQKVYFPKQMQGTYFAQMMVQADYIMKQLILGVNQKGEPFQYPESLKKVGMDFQSLIQYINMRKERNRQWIVLKKVHFLQNDEKGIKIGDIEMGIQIRAQQIGEDGKLKDSQVQVSIRKKRFCQLFNQHYNLIAEEYEVFKTIKRLAKASTIAKLMRTKGFKINLQLINQLFQKQKTDKSSKIIPKLHNEISLEPHQVPLLKYQEPISKVHFTFTGGCDLGYNQQMAAFQSLKDSLTEETESENIYVPFLFQSFIECQEQSCQNICNNGLESIDTNKCDDHTSKICNLCWDLLKPGQKFVVIKDDRLFHRECFHCQACYGYIDGGSYTQVQKMFYHQTCAPIVSIGKCYICGSDINRTEGYLSNSKGLIHSHCAQNFKCQLCGEKCSLLLLTCLNSKYYHKQCIKCTICRCQIQDGTILISSQGFVHQACVPKNICQICKEDISGSFIVMSDKKYHQDCIPKSICDICKEDIKEGGVTLNNQSYHDACLICYKCKGQLQEEINILDGKFYHPACLA